MGCALYFVFLFFFLNVHIGKRFIIYSFRHFVETYLSSESRNWSMATNIALVLLLDKSGHSNPTNRLTTATCKGS